jgi:hypothetical protein
VVEDVVYDPSSNLHSFNNEEPKTLLVSTPSGIMVDLSIYFDY